MSEGSYGPRVAEGVYRARGVEAALGETKGGKEQVGILFQIIDEGGDMDGEHVQWHGFFTEKTIARTMESLRTAGWNTDDVSNLSGVGDVECSITVEHETYEGKTRARVAWVNKPAGLGMKTPLVGDKAKAFAARMKGYAIKSRAAGAAPNAAGAYAHPNAAPAAKVPIGRRPDFGPTAPLDDEIPF